MLVGSLSTAVVVDQNQDEVCCCVFGFLQLQFCCEIFSVAPSQCSDTVFCLFLCQGLYAILLLQHSFQLFYWTCASAAFICSALLSSVLGPISVLWCKNCDIFLKTWFLLCSYYCTFLVCRWISSYNLVFLMTLLHCDLRYLIEKIHFISHAVCLEFTRFHCS